jgi:hypothetical protein
LVCPEIEFCWARKDPRREVKLMEETATLVEETTEATAEEILDVVEETDAYEVMLIQGSVY